MHGYLGYKVYTLNPTHCSYVYQQQSKAYWEVVGGASQVCDCGECICVCICVSGLFNASGIAWTVCSQRKRVVMLIHAETFRSQYLATHSVLVHTVFTRHIFCSPRYLCCSSLRQLGHTLEVLSCVVFVLHDDLESPLPERRDEEGPGGNWLGPPHRGCKAGALMTIRGRPLWYPLSCLDIAS